MTPLVQDSDFTLHVGDVRGALRELEPESVHCVVTSPPYDAEAVREPHKDFERGANGKRVGSGPDERPQPGVRTGTMLGVDRDGAKREYNPAGRNIRSVWNIATEPYPEAHFATFPQALVEPCIKAGTSERGCCPECGAPWVRETTVAYALNARTGGATSTPRVGHAKEGPNFGDYGMTQKKDKLVETTGWNPSCECSGRGAGNGISEPKARHALIRPEPVPCIVLDPFLGSGTTALVARRLGRRCIGIELNPKFAEMAAERTRQLSLLA